MQIELDADLACFFEEMVREGQFASVQEAVNTVLGQFRDYGMPGELDDETEAGLVEAIDESERGEGIPSERVRAEFKTKYGIG